MGSLKMNLKFTFCILVLAIGVGCSSKKGFRGATNSGLDVPPPIPGDACVTVQISWTAPTTYDDPAKTPIPPGVLAGYKLYRGVSPGNYTDEMVINGGETQNISLSGLNKSVTYYFAMKSLATDGTTSAYTKEVPFFSNVCKTVRLSFTNQTDRYGETREL